MVHVSITNIFPQYITNITNIFNTFITLFDNMRINHHPAPMFDGLLL